MILLLVILAYGLTWLVIGSMLVAAAVALIPVLVLIFLFALIGALLRPRGGSR